jgi:hypothetical protein
MSLNSEEDAAVTFSMHEPLLGAEPMQQDADEAKASETPRPPPVIDPSPESARTESDGASASPLGALHSALLSHPSPCPSPESPLAPAVLAGGASVRTSFSLTSTASTTSAAISSALSAAFPFTTNAFVRTLLSLAMFSYQHTCATALYFLECVSVAGHRVMFAYPSIACDESQYKHLMPAMIVLIAVLVMVLPALLFMLMYRYRSESVVLSRTRADMTAAEIIARHLRARARIGILFESYKQSFPYWQLIVMLRQVLLVSLGIIFHEDHSMRYLSFSLFNCVGLLLHLLCQPYAAELSNRAETVALQLLVFVSITLLATTPPLNQLTQIALSILVIPFVIGFTITIIATRLRRTSFRRRKNAGTNTEMEKSEQEVERRKVEDSRKS